MKNTNGKSSVSKIVCDTHRNANNMNVFYILATTTRKRFYIAAFFEKVNFKTMEDAFVRVKQERKYGAAQNAFLRVVLRTIRSFLTIQITDLHSLYIACTACYRQTLGYPHETNLMR